MIGNRIVLALLEDEEVDPKSFAMRTSGVYDDAIQTATSRFMAAYNDGQIQNPRRADELAHEIAQDACAEHGLDDNDDFDEVVTPLFKLSAELFPGQW